MAAIVYLRAVLVKRFRSLAYFASRAIQVVSEFFREGCAALPQHMAVSLRLTVEGTQKLLGGYASRA